MAQALGIKKGHPIALAGAQILPHQHRRQGQIKNRRMVHHQATHHLAQPQTRLNIKRFPGPATFGLNAQWACLHLKVKVLQGLVCVQRNAQGGFKSLPHTPHREQQLSPLHDAISPIGILEAFTVHPSKLTAVLIRPHPTLAQRRADLQVLGGQVQGLTLRAKKTKHPSHHRQPS